MAGSLSIGSTPKISPIPSRGVHLSTFLIKIDSNVEDSTNLKYHPRLLRMYALVCGINSLLAQTSDDSAVCEKIIVLNDVYELVLYKMCRQHNLYPRFSQ